MSVSCESFYFLSLIEERYTRFHFELIMIPKQSQHDAGYVVSTSLFADVIFDGSEKAVRRAVLMLRVAGHVGVSRCCATADR